MILRTLLLTASLGAGLMTAVSGYAMPITARSEAALASSTAATDIGYREHGDDDDDREYGEHRNKHHGRHGEDHDRYAANGCGEDDDDGDDDAHGASFPPLGGCCRWLATVVVYCPRWDSAGVGISRRRGLVPAPARPRGPRWRWRA